MYIGTSTVGRNFTNRDLSALGGQSKFLRCAVSSLKYQLTLEQPSLSVYIAGINYQFVVCWFGLMPYIFLPVAAGAEGLRL